MVLGASPGYSGKGKELLRMLRFLRQFLLMNSTESSNTMWRSWVTVLVFLPTIVNTTGIAPSMWSGVLSAVFSVMSDLTSTALGIA